MARPVLVYDGDCGFCVRSVCFLRRWVSTPARFVAWQSADLEALGTSRTRAAYELLWISSDGRVHGGAQAVARLLWAAGGAWTAVGIAMWLPPVRWLAHLVYRLIARNRHRLPAPPISQ